MTAEVRDLLLERILSHVGLPPDSECWLWTRYVNEQGYGRVNVKGKSRGAHRVLYELMVGPIADGLVLDHLCRVRHCVNPAHLEPVTNAENIRRGNAPTEVAWRNGTCVRGLHDMAVHGMVIVGRGRQCRACKSASMAARYRRLKAAS